MLQFPIFVLMELNKRRCCTCKEIKEVSDFHKNKPDCKICRSMYAKAVRVKGGGTNRIDRSQEVIGVSKTCTICKQVLALNEFGKGISRCRECVRKYNRIYLDALGVKEKFKPVLTPNGKQCAHCKAIKPLIEFSNSKRGRLGKSAYCKLCTSWLAVNKHTTKEERRKRTQEWRDNNREWWRFLHRLTQFNRRAKEKRVADGTVTKEFMLALYNTIHCYYCNQVTSKDKRTCDHRVPLNKGGVHGISNLVMACHICNSTKRDMLEEEFINYLKQLK